MKQMIEKNKMIDAQCASGYEPGSNGRAIFSRILGATSSLLGYRTLLKAQWLETPLGPMIAVSDEEALYLLEFTDSRGVERELARLQQQTKSTLISAQTKPIASIQKELDEYFAGKLTQFKTKLNYFGSAFQQRVWSELKKIPYGDTCSYLQIAQAIGKPTACRAVANANGANQIAIVIPCHRVIHSNGNLGGYAGGVTRKQSLLALEKNNR